jgi:hypothetical protein
MSNSVVTIGLNISGLLTMFEQKEAAVREAAEMSVDLTGEHVFELSQGRVPVQTGALRDSGRITKVRDGDNYKNIISYGNEATGEHGVATARYALEQHEIHSKKNPEAYKFLEKPLYEAEEFFQDCVTDLVGDALK